MSRTFRLANLLVLLVAILACGGPLWIIPGGRLSGAEASASAWAEVVSDSGTLDLETRPADPYSVRIGYVLLDGNIYIDPAEGRGWYQELKANPVVRVRLADRIYRARAVAVSDPTLLANFAPERHVQRLDLLP